MERLTSTHHRRTGSLRLLGDTMDMFSEGVTQFLLHDGFSVYDIKTMFSPSDLFGGIGGIFLFFESTDSIS